MNYCKDCKHFAPLILMCVRGRQQVGNDPVNGSPEYKYKVCDYAFNERARILPWHCGKRGRHFAPKESSDV